ncbi:MAG: MucR family transcriptional regulator [Alphaproteobacteria bacterium]
MADNLNKDEILALTTEIVSSYVSNNSLSVNDIPKFINEVCSTLSNLSSCTSSEPKLEPAVPIKKSIMPDYIVCLEDGKKLKMLKRHLKTAYSMTPEEYRDRWGLPVDYPMVAPNYADHRSSLAKKIGLGTKPKK